MSEIERLAHVISAEFLDMPVEDKPKEIVRLILQAMREPSEAALEHKV